MNDVLPVKDEDHELPVPARWRDTLSAIVDALVGNDFGLNRRIARVASIDAETATFIKESLSSYGEELIALPAASWDTSIALWMDPYWDVLVDLHTTPTGRSDLVLFVRVYEVDEDFAFEVESLHVP